MAWKIPHWTARVVIVVLVVFGVVWLGMSWIHANDIRGEFLIPRPALEGYPLTVTSNEAGRVTATRTGESEREGVWGLEGETSYAQVSTIVRLSDEDVERGVKTLVGEFEAGDSVRIDPDAYAGDPFTSHRIGWEPLVIPSEIGPHAGWFIDGRRSTWVVFVHGKGDDRLAESLRVIPSLVEQGFPIMVITLRNDVGATPSESGMRLWGLEEWRDVDAAIKLGQRKGGQDFVVIGSGFGASIVSTFLHESDQIGAVRGVVYDSPVVDLEGVVGRWSQENGTPRIVGWLGRRLATIRFGMEWNLLNQIDRADEFDVPMLIMLGGEDPVSYPEDIEAFADAVGDLSDRQRFEQGGHTDLWNIDQVRYESVLSVWLQDLLGSE
jgi:pimeloyl-ACP methyl ester carboxylesterase